MWGFKATCYAFTSWQQTTNKQGAYG